MWHTRPHSSSVLETTSQPSVSSSGPIPAKTCNTSIDLMVFVLQTITLVHCFVTLLRSAYPLAVLSITALPHDESFEQLTFLPVLCFFPLSFPSRMSSSKGISLSLSDYRGLVCHYLGLSYFLLSLFSVLHIP